MVQNGTLGTLKDAISNALTSALLLFSVAYDEGTQLCCGPQRILHARPSERHVCCGHKPYDAGAECCCSNNEALEIQPAGSSGCPRHPGGPPKRTTSQEVSCKAKTRISKSNIDFDFDLDSPFIPLDASLMEKNNSFRKIVKSDDSCEKGGQAEAAAVSGVSHVSWQ